MTSEKMVIGTRGSELALYQANFIKDILIGQHDCSVEIKIIKTTGDKIDNLPFDKMEGKGFFTKELEEALLSGEIDLAVHSLKDQMTSQPDGLTLGAVGFRADSRELLLIRPEAVAENGFLPVKDGAVLGTSSARRQCQVFFHNPSFKIKDLRGNVPTRVRRLRDGNYDAIIVAAAGLDRLELDLSGLKAVRLDPGEFLPAPAQGILGIQMRRDDKKTAEVVARLNSDEAELQSSLERGLLARYDSGCTLPLGVESDLSGGKMRLKAVLGVRSGDSWSGLKCADVSGDNPEQVVTDTYNQLQESRPIANSRDQR
ncbi:MAG: hydroxymethylbilane synthase [bacterium]|nr:hydroxymethylbilane synthase [bacterium]